MGATPMFDAGFFVAPQQEATERRSDEGKRDPSLRSG
jgi:hypothetical protein